MAIIDVYHNIYSILIRRYDNIKNNEEVKQLIPNSHEFQQYKINLFDRGQLEQVYDTIRNIVYNNYDENDVVNFMLMIIQAALFDLSGNEYNYSNSMYATYAVNYAVIIINKNTSQYASTSEYIQFAYNLLRIQNNEMKTVNQIVQYNDTDNFNLDDLKVILDSLADQNYPHNDLIELLPNNRLRLKVFNITGADNNDIVNQVEELPFDYQVIIFDTIKKMYSL